MTTPKKLKTSISLGSTFSFPKNKSYLIEYLRIFLIYIKEVDFDSQQTLVFIKHVTLLIH